MLISVSPLIFRIIMGQSFPCASVVVVVVVATTRFAHPHGYNLILSATNNIEMSPHLCIGVWTGIIAIRSRIPRVPVLLLPHRRNGGEGGEAVDWNWSGKMIRGKMAIKRIPIGVIETLAEMIYKTTFMTLANLFLPFWFNTWTPS